MINFQGLPTPAVGLFFMGLPLLPIDLTHTIIITLIIIFSFLMVSSIKFYSIKINIRENRRFLFFLLILYGIVSLGLIIAKIDLLSFFSISIIIYVLLNLVLVIFRAIGFNQS
jgi:phosphatidylserine synthase